MSSPANNKDGKKKPAGRGEGSEHVTPTSTSTYSPDMSVKKPGNMEETITTAVAPLVSGMAPAHTDPLAGAPPELFSTASDDQDDLPPLERKTPFFSAKLWKAAIPVLLTPSLYGYNIGLVGPYSTLYTYATNCQLYEAQVPCESLSAAKCQWMEATTVNASSTLGMVCGWKAPHSTCFLKYFDATSCGSDNDCEWSYSAGTCGNKVGYSSILSGLFAGSMIMGATVGSLAGGYLTKKFDYRKSFLLIGVISLIGAILTHVATGIFQYWLLFVARIIVGVAMGWQTITTPHYTDKFAPAEHVKTVGSFFQCGISFFIFMASVFGICLGMTIDYGVNRNANLMGRMQGMVVLPTLLSLLVLFLPLVTRDGYSMSKTANYEDAEVAEAGEKKKSTAKKYPFSTMIGPILNGVAMASVSQLTGINANMNFAPTIMSNLGLPALLGNLIVMAWNAFATFFVIPLSRKFTMRTLFLVCGIVGSLCCIFLSGIPVYPGVTKDPKAVNGIAITGIAIFIATYEMGVGPCFYVLAVDVFPESFRPIGSSITTAVMMVFNMIINICYPIATEGISGGPSGNPNKGQSIAFIFFGGIGTFCVCLEYFFLHPWEDEKEDVPAPHEIGNSEEASM